MNTGLAGEIRCIVKAKDGSIIADTDFQKNMILDTGLDFFGGGQGVSMFDNCLVGSGTLAPKATDKVLGSFVAKHSSIDEELSGSEPYFFGDPEYKVWHQKTYRFFNLEGKTVSEVGLASKFTSQSSYYLCTKALIKNSEGSPISITLKKDEVLEITYRVWQVFAVADSIFDINVADDVGGSKAFTAICRLAGVNDEAAEYPEKVGRVLEADTDTGANFNDFYSYAGDIGDATTTPLMSMGSASSATFSQYESGTYTRDLNVFFGLDDARYPVRSVLVPTTMGTFQVQYSSKEGDEPIPKSKNDTLTIPIRFTWSRYDGELNATEG